MPTLPPMNSSDESEFLSRLFGAAADGMILVDGARDQVLAINQVATNQLGLAEATQLPAANALYAMLSHTNKAVTKLGDAAQLFD